MKYRRDHRRTHAGLVGNYYWSDGEFDNPPEQGGVPLRVRIYCLELVISAGTHAVDRTVTRIYYPSGQADAAHAAAEAYCQTVNASFAKRSE